MIKMKCIGNEIKGMQYYSEGVYDKGPYGCADEHHNWLEIGKVYEIMRLVRLLAKCIMILILVKLLIC